MFSTVTYTKAEFTPWNTLAYNCKLCHEIAEPNDFSLVTSKCGVNGSSQMVYVLRRCFECKKFLKLKGVETVGQFYELLLKDIL